MNDLAWYADNSGGQRIDSAQILTQDAKHYVDRLVADGNTVRAVGLKQPNAFNLYDILGNIWE